MKRYFYQPLFKGIVLTLLIALAGVFVHINGISIFTTNQASCRHCNVVIISLDTTRATELPCYGYARNTMPNLCRFADQNIRFDSAYSQSSWTFPSATSVMTGLYPSDHHMYDNTLDTLHPSIATLPKLYKQAGYHTIAIINSQEPNIPFPAELTKQFDTVISTRGFHLDAEIQAWIDTFSKESKGNKPLFLYIYTTQIGYYRSTDVGLSKTFPLDPSFSPPELAFQKTFTPDIRRDAIALVTSLQRTATDSATKARYDDYIKNLSSSTLEQAKLSFNTLSDAEQLFLYQEAAARRLSITNPQHLRYIQNLYDETLNTIDTYLGPMLDLLGDKTHQKNTIAIFYSDHGENLGDHGLWGHAMNPYSTLTHVPFIMQIPHVPPTVRHDIVQLIDIFPTILSLTGVAVPNPVSGKNIWPVSPPSQTPFTIAQLDYGDESSIKTSQWLLLSHRGSNGTITDRLYDLQNDPNETKDVGPAHTDIIQNLTQMYAQATHANSQ
jgi:arylsulfatase A-like enzyme